MPKNGIVQWGWAEMEELLQCPVCLDIPASGPGVTVEQCIHGHHICASCKTQVENCPLCKCAFHGTRNFVVEELIRHFEVLKNTMLLSNIVLESKPKKKSKSNSDDSASTPTPNNASVPRRCVNTPNASKGLYPCRATDCNEKLPSGRLLNHVRSYHTDVLTEALVDFTDSYCQTWDIPYRNKKPINKYSFVIFVSGIGLVFLTIEILRSGQLIAVIQMATKFRQAQNFLACIEFFSESTTYSYNTRMVSVRDNIQYMMLKGLCFTLNKEQLRNVCVNKKFSCKMRLSRFNPVDSNILTVPNMKLISNIAAYRASLITEENDKKLLKELGGTSNNRKSSANGPIVEQKTDNDHARILRQMKEFEDTLRTLTKTFQIKQEASVTVNGSSSQACQNGASSSSSVTTTEPSTTGRRRRNRRRNRIVGSGPPSELLQAASSTNRQNKN